MVLKNCKNIMSFLVQSFLVQFDKKQLNFFWVKILFFFSFFVYTKMKQIKCENNTIAHKKSESS